MVHKKSLTLLTDNRPNIQIIVKFLQLNSIRVENRLKRQKKTTKLV